MILGKVISRIVSTAKLESLPHKQLLSIQPLKGFGPQDVRFVAIDAIEAGPGDCVLVLQEGTGAREVLWEEVDQPLPAQMVVVGIVDEIQGAEGLL